MHRNIGRPRGFSLDRCYVILGMFGLLDRSWRSAYHAGFCIPPHFGAATVPSTSAFNAPHGNPLLEPGMLIRSVIGDEIQNDLEPSRMSRREHRIELLQRAEPGDQCRNSR